MQTELAAATPTQRNWRGILIALLVIAAVLGLIVFSIALLTPAGDGGRVRGRRPTLHDVLTEHYKPFNGTWLTALLTNQKMYENSFKSNECLLYIAGD
ncbi:unnamed protein product [Arctia plantaginis]|uniref:Uncharacterized protein n=1 Tax=Arctia plantaginis TaxID=874455 RepID=A0A8S1AJ72_ARCPL|nr:unnamed protein product [Arctia plantaginis]